jgi:hypothetical protein
MYVSHYGFILKTAVGKAELSDFVLFSLAVFGEIERKTAVRVGTRRVNFPPQRIREAGTAVA